MKSVSFIFIFAFFKKESVSFIFFCIFAFFLRKRFFNFYICPLFKKAFLLFSFFALFFGKRFFFFPFFLKGEGVSNQQPCGGGREVS